MKKLVLLKIVTLFISIAFAILAFIGAVYVLLNHGQVNAGYAVIPMLFCYAFINIYNVLKKKEKEQ